MCVMVSLSLSVHVFFVAWQEKCVIDMLSVESCDLLLFQQCVCGDSVLS